MASTLLLPGLGLAATQSTFEVKGEILPHQVGSVELYSVSSSFAEWAQAGPDGRFRFKNVQRGAYTISIATQSGGEVRQTVEVSTAAADHHGRVNCKISADSENVNREASTTVSARAWQIPDHALREYKEAQKKITRRDVEGAVAHLLRAVEIEPRFAAAWNQLGTMAYQGQRYQEAERYFRRGLEADPNAYEPLVNLGGVLLNLGNFEDALQYNSEAVKHRPNDALAQSQLGMTYAFLNQLDAAEKHLLIAIRLDPHHFSHPQLSLAEVYLRRNQPGDAAEQLQDFLRGHPDWPTAAKMKQLIPEWQSRSGQASIQSAAEQRK